MLTILVLKSLASLGQPCIIMQELALRDVQIVLVPDRSAPLLREFPIEVAILDDRRRNNPFGVIEHRAIAPGHQKSPKSRSRGHRNLRHRSGTRGR